MSIVISGSDSASGACDTACVNGETTGSSSDSINNNINDETIITSDTNADKVKEPDTEATTGSSGPLIEKLIAVDTRKDPADVLPDDLFLKIFDYLPEYYLSIASKKWNGIVRANNSQGWKRAVQRKWKTSDNPDNMDWKDLYNFKLTQDVLWQNEEYETKVLPLSVFGVCLLDPIKALCWDKEGNLILFDLREKREISRFRAHDDQIWWTCAKPSGIVATGSEDKTVKIIRVNSTTGTFEVLHTLVGHSFAAWMTEISEEADIVVSGTEKNEVFIWSLSTGELIHKVNCDKDIMSGWYDIKVVDPKTKLIAGAARKSLVLIDGIAGKVTRVLDKTSMYIPNFVNVAPITDTPYLVTSDTIRRLKVWDVRTGAKINELTLPGIAECVFARNGKLYTSVDVDGKDFYVMVWSLACPEAPEYLYNINVEYSEDGSKKATRKRLYAVEITDASIVCCTQGEGDNLLYTTTTANKSLLAKYKKKYFKDYFKLLDNDDLDESDSSSSLSSPRSSPSLSSLNPSNSQGQSSSSFSCLIS